jgi:hypothetical protein
VFRTVTGVTSATAAASACVTRSASSTTRAAV